jgi:hypothetical protein
MEHKTTKLSSGVAKDIFIKLFNSQHEAIYNKIRDYFIINKERSERIIRIKCYQNTNRNNSYISDKITLSSNTDDINNIIETLKNDLIKQFGDQILPRRYYKLCIEEIVYPQPDKCEHKNTYITEYIDIDCNHDFCNFGCQRFNTSGRKICKDCGEQVYDKCTKVNVIELDRGLVTCFNIPSESIFWQIEKL